MCQDRAASGCVTLESLTSSAVSQCGIGSPLSEVENAGMSSVLAAASIAELLAQYIDSTWAYALAALIHAALVLGFFGVAPLVYIWLERKVAGRIQDRLGPTRVGGKFGWLQTLADGIKLIQKEDLCQIGRAHV